MVVSAVACGSPSKPTKDPGPPAPLTKPADDRATLPLATASAKLACTSAMPRKALCPCLKKAEGESEDDAYKWSCELREYKDNLAVATTELRNDAAGLSGHKGYLVYDGPSGVSVIASLAWNQEGRRSNLSSTRTIEVIDAAPRKLIHVVETILYEDISGRPWEEKATTLQETICVVHAGKAQCPLQLDSAKQTSARARPDITEEDRKLYQKEHNHALPHDTRWKLRVELTAAGVVRVSRDLGTPPKDAKLGAWRLW